ncbi:hypothetical protein J6590_101679 [Homalodisca vitripennis]|nr:hypothetical protein J6590_101679 [Homalodisca vitripennis]
MRESIPWNNWSAHKQKRELRGELRQFLLYPEPSLQVRLGKKGRRSEVKRRTGHFIHLSPFTAAVTGIGIGLKFGVNPSIYRIRHKVQSSNTTVTAITKIIRTLRSHENSDFVEIRSSHDESQDGATTANERNKRGSLPTYLGRENVRPVLLLHFCQNWLAGRPRDAFKRVDRQKGMNFTNKRSVCYIWR